MKTVNLKEEQPWILAKRTDAEAPVFRSYDANSQLTRNAPDAGKDWGQKKRVSEDEMVGWHHWCNGHELGQTSGDGEGQGSLACCSIYGCKKSDKTRPLNNNNIHHYSIIQSSLFSLKILCAPPTHPSLSPIPSNHSSSYRPHNFGLFWNVIQYVAFSDWLLSLSNMQLCFLHVFSWFDSSFHFSTG